MTVENAHDFIRWALAFKLTIFLEVSNQSSGKALPLHWLIDRKLINLAEYQMIKGVKDNNAGSPSFLFISWMQQRLVGLLKKGSINNEQFKILSEEVRDLRRNGATISDKADVMIPWPIHQMANFIASAWLIMVGLQYSLDKLGIISYLWQLFAIQITRLISARLAHPFRLNAGWYWTHEAPSASIHAFPLIFGKVRSAGNYLRHATSDIYLSSTFGQYISFSFNSYMPPPNSAHVSPQDSTNPYISTYRNCNPIPGYHIPENQNSAERFRDTTQFSQIEFNSKNMVDQLTLALNRHQTKCLEAKGSNHLVDWCKCSGNATENLRPPAFGRLGRIFRYVGKFLKSIINPVEKNWKALPDIPSEEQFMRNPINMV